MRVRLIVSFGVVLTLLLLALLPGAAVSPTGWTVVAWNNLGMHCMDADFAVFAILPPYNTIHAQVVDPSGKLVKSGSSVSLTYEAVADPTGSINTTSVGKTNFWDHVVSLFGAAVPVDAGLAGKDMPGPGNAPKAMTFDGSRNWFVAEGIPITPYDDAGRKNPYPLMKVTARDASGNLLASARVVLPVSDEMDCRGCHGSGSAPAARPAAGWVFDADPERDYRLNVLRLHDEAAAASPAYAPALAAAGYDPAGLYVTATAKGKAVLCAACHSSEALPGSGKPGVPPLTRAVHALHAGVADPATGLSLGSSANRSSCYRCHPGSETKCLRGAMGAATAADGSMLMQCQDCHGGMAAVGAATRTGWLDEPTCQQCHTGTATRNSGQIRFTSVFDGAGNPRVAADARFATNADTPGAGLSLYRFSKGHGGLQCSACHGATHAEYPSSHENDNLQSLDLQGHAGTLAECAACHRTVPRTASGRASRDAHGRLLVGGGARRRGRARRARLLPGLSRGRRPRHGPLADVRGADVRRRGRERELRGRDTGRLLQLPQRARRGRRPSGRRRSDADADAPGDRDTEPEPEPDPDRRADEDPDPEADRRADEDPDTEADPDAGPLADPDAAAPSQAGSPRGNGRPLRPGGRGPDPPLTPAEPGNEFVRRVPRVDGDENGPPRLLRRGGPVIPGPG